jgi:hypothetical protein
VSPGSSKRPLSKDRECFSSNSSAGLPHIYSADCVWALVPVLVRLTRTRMMRARLGARPKAADPRPLYLVLCWLWALLCHRAPCAYVCQRCLGPGAAGCSPPLRPLTTAPCPLLLPSSKSIPTRNSLMCPCYPTATRSTEVACSMESLAAYFGSPEHMALHHLGVSVYVLMLLPPPPPQWCRSSASFLHAGEEAQL